MQWPDFWKGPYFDRRDCWLGWYFDRDWYRHGIRTDGPRSRRLRVWICLVPCFPVQLTWLEPGYQERDKASQAPYFRERVERSRSVSAGPADRAGAGGEG